MSTGPYILYGIELSLYSGKVRSYLRKKGLPFSERTAAHPGFARAAASVGAEKQPLLETQDGSFVQDTTEIIDFLEARHPEPAVFPSGPCQRLVALLFELYGDEGLMKPAMHYRWNFPDENDAFLRAEFARGLRADALDARVDAGGPSSSEAMLDALQHFMRSRVIPALGVTPSSVKAIEAAYEDLLAGLEAHFRELPYLLGGRPSIGDFGMIAPLYAHLGRDPYPSSLMKRHAPSVHRWVERMTVADSGMAEFPDVAESFLPDDEIPESLLPILRLMAEDYMPELLGIASSVDDWLARHPGTRPGDLVPASTDGMGTVDPLGTHRVTLRGVEIELAIQHYSLWMLGRVQDHYDRLGGQDAQRADQLLGACGLAPLMAARPALRVERRDFREVFG